MILIAFDGILQQNKRFLDFFILSFGEDIIFLSVEDNDIQLIHAFINIDNKELIGFFIVVGPAVFIENIFVFVVFECKLLKVDVFHDFPGFIELDAGIDFFCECVHLIGGGFLFLVVVAFELGKGEGFVVVGDVIVAELEVGQLELAGLKFFDMHQLDEKLFQFLVLDVVVKCYCH